MSIKVCIGNYGYYNEGELRDAWLELPIADGELMPWLASHGLYDELHEEIYVSDYDGVPFGLHHLFSEFTMVDELNLLASQMESLDDGVEERVKAWCSCADEPSTVLELMNLLEQVDDLPIYGYSFDFAWDKDEWGTYWVDRQTPETNLGYEFLQYNEALRKVFEKDPDAESAFDVERYGKLIEDRGCEAFDHFYVDRSMDGPALDKFDLDYFKSEYGLGCDEDEEES